MPKNRKKALSDRMIKQILESNKKLTEHLELLSAKDRVQLTDELIRNFELIVENSDYRIYDLREFNELTESNLIDIIRTSSTIISLATFISDTAVYILSKC